MSKQYHNKHQRGFTLLISIVTTALLLLISFVVVNISFKQLLLAYSGQESQYAFYNADSGIECAMYYDLKNGAVSAFDTAVSGAVSCNGTTVTTGTQTVPTIPSQPSRIGGGGSGAPISIFYIPYSHGCAIIKVIKYPATTTIESRGYNTCNTSADKRVERGISLTY